MKKFIQILMGTISVMLLGTVVALGQSNHTVTFTGNSSDFNGSEKLWGGDDVDYYVTFDETYLYIGAFRVNGQTFGKYDHFSVYVDSDPKFTPTQGNGSTTGVSWDGNTPILSFNADYRIVGRKGNALGDSFYSSYSGGWNTGSENEKGWTQYISEYAIQIRVPFTDLGDPNSIYLTMYMSYGGGFYGTSDANFPVTISKPNINGYFGLIPIKSDIKPLSISNSPGLTITGAAGWRMLSSPANNTTLQSLLKDNGIFTQCFTGADIEGGICATDPSVSENVYFYDTGNNAWTAATNITNTVDAGTGVLVYVYEDDDPNQAGTIGGFPKTISISGTENPDTSPSMNASASGFTLLGNPFASSIDWSSVSTTNLNGTIYVWDVNDGTGNGGKSGETTAGSWKTNAAGTGDHNGTIASFQGFFVENASASPTVSFTDADKTTGGVFYGKEVSKQIVRLELNGEGMSNSAWLRFSENGALQKTRGDALQLDPLSTNYAMLATQKADGQLFDIAHLPVLEEEFNLPVTIEATKSGMYKISATDFSLPDNLELYFYDRELDQSVRLDAFFSYEFELQKAAKINPNPLAKIQNGIQAKRAKTGGPRFAITSNVSVSNEPTSSPKEFSLEQNYPNPFNPTTRIQYSVKESGPVSLTVYNVMGQQVEALVSKAQSAGTYRVSWNAANMASGIYYYRLQAGNQIITRQMTLIK